MLESLGFVVALIIKVSLAATQPGCNHGDVRLVNGTTLQEGRLEICINSNWSTVCQHSWGTRDSWVVCRQLGYNENAGRGIYGAYFGQGVGLIALDNVDCEGNEATLLNCSYRGLFMHNCDHSEDVSVRCILREDQRVKNITVSVEIIRNQPPSTVHAALISWVLYNTTTDIPNSFDVKCSNEQHSITMSVSGQNFTYLLGLLPSTSYNCCVSAVYKYYIADSVCDGIETPNLTVLDHTATMFLRTLPMDSDPRNSETKIVGGVLGFIVVILLVLLIISGAALAYLLLKRNTIPARSLESTGHGKNNTINIPVQYNNQSYVKAPGASNSTTKARGAQAVAIQNQLDNEAGPDYSRFGPDYETINSSKRPQRKNQTPAAAVHLSEQYEYSEAHLATLNEEGLGNPNYEVPLNLRQNVSTENEDYSRLQH